MKNGHRLVEAVMKRDKGTALLTVCNHLSYIDDPAVYRMYTTIPTTLQMINYIKNCTFNGFYYTCINTHKHPWEKSDFVNKICKIFLPLLTVSSFQDMVSLYYSPLGPVSQMHKIKEGDDYITIEHACAYRNRCGQDFILTL